MRVEGSQAIRIYASYGLSGFEEYWKQTELGPETIRGYHHDNIEQIRRCCLVLPDPPASRMRATW
jgi:hypothetical protein